MQLQMPVNEVGNDCVTWVTLQNEAANGRAQAFTTIFRCTETAKRRRSHPLANYPMSHHPLNTQRIRLGC